MTKRRRDDRGAAMVEFALILPLLLMLLMGIIEFGRAYNTQVSIQAAAREGARELALGHDAEVVAARASRSSVGHHRFDLRAHRARPRATARLASSSASRSRSAFLSCRSAPRPSPRQESCDAVSDRDDHDDRGAVLVWVALMLVVLFGFGALVIDVGALYAERRQLQNGADAAALGGRRRLRRGRLRTSRPLRTPTPTANANDGAANVDEVCGSGPGLATCPTPPPAPPARPAGCKVTTSTHNPANSNATRSTSSSRRCSTPPTSADRPRLGGRRLGTRRRGDDDPVRLLGLRVRASAARSTAQTSRPPGYIYSHGTDPRRLPRLPRQLFGSEPAWRLRLAGRDELRGPVAVGGLGRQRHRQPACRGLRPTDVAERRGAHPALRRDARHAASDAEYHIVGFAGFKVLGYELRQRGRWNDADDGKCTVHAGQQRTLPLRRIHPRDRPPARSAAALTSALAPSP